MSFLKETSDLSFVIFYGSQLGQAKSIAEGVVNVAEEYDFKTKAFELNVIKDVVSVHIKILIINKWGCFYFINDW